MSSPELTPLSSIEGRIEHLLITLPPAPDVFLDQYYQELVSTFADREEVILYRNYEPPRHPEKQTSNVILQEMDLEEQLYAIMGSRKVLSFFPVPDFLPDYVGDLVEYLKEGTPIANSEWAQDPFSVLRDASGGTILLQPLFSNRYMDKFISLSLCTRRGINALIKPTELLIEGGNILAGNGFILAGKDLLAQNILRKLRNIKDHNSSQYLKQAMEIQFQEEFGVKDVIWIGFDRAVRNWKRNSELTYQPLFHIDLFITMGGTTSEGKQLLFLGDPQLSIDLLEEKVAPSLLKIPPPALEQFKDIKAFFHKYQRERRPGMPDFEVVPVPIFIYHDVIYSFNNCLVESYPGARSAYLPQYLVGKEDDRYEQLNPVFEILQPMAEDIFRAHGFTDVKWIGPGKFFRKLCLMRGSLHCITKVLKRV